MSIQVRAKEPGFYDCLRATGETFAIESKKDLGKWMEVVEKPKPEEPKAEK